MTLPFTFAWVNPDQTTFDPATMNVEDEHIISFDLQHDEGQIPTLDIIVKNPRVGLLAPGRKLHAWLAWYNGSTLLPLFFGVLVGIPSDMFKEQVKLQLIARSPQFIANKQALAETMKVSPYFDPIWFDTAHRDDPDSILEGWSALWHIDRITQAITASDILQGEDGTVTFDENTALYDSVGFKPGQPPLVNVRVVAKVNWTQRSSGYVQAPPLNITTYTGDTFLGDWPKPGAGLGGGYRVESSYVTDIYNVSNTPQTSFNYEWHNTDPDKGNCSNESRTTTSSGPALLSPNPISVVLTGELKSGLCDPYGDPPTNIPASASVTGMIIPLWAFKGQMTLRYDASRQYAEQITFDMLANVQGILASPTVSQDTEVITINSIDLGKPIFNVLAWTDFKNSVVPFTQIIFPNDPTTPGGLSYQIAINSGGVAGSVEPEFSDIPGVVTIDGTVHWASLGDNSLTDATAWTPASFVPVGTIINLPNSVFNPAIGEWEDQPGQTSYYLCLRAGQTNTAYTTTSYTPPLVSNDEPTPEIQHLARINPPTFSTTVGQQIGDGSVIWIVLGTSPPTLVIPLGGTPTSVTASHFFDTPRGIQALEFLISKARARLRLRARAVSVNWEAPFATGVGLSCRKNATLFDPRLPGGAATGKITSYTLSASGDGKLRTKVEIGCPVGFGDSIAEITGTPEYALAGYMQPGYQLYDGAMVSHGSGETTFSRPVYRPYDDGAQFPLRWQDISGKGWQVNGTIEGQKAAIIASFKALLELQYLDRWADKTGTVPTSGPSSSATILDSTEAWSIEREQMALASQSTPYVMQANSISATLLLSPVTGNSFEGAYAIVVSPLTVPQGINLEAPSSP